jgi:hypothetical protein
MLMLSKQKQARLINADCGSGKRRFLPLVRESAPHQQACNCHTVIKISSYASDGCFIPRETGWLTVGRNIRLTLRLRLRLNLMQQSWNKLTSSDVCNRRTTGRIVFCGLYNCVTLRRNIILLLRVLYSVAFAMFSETRGLAAVLRFPTRYIQTFGSQGSKFEVSVVSNMADALVPGYQKFWTDKRT